MITEDEPEPEPVNTLKVVLQVSGVAALAGIVLWLTSAGGANRIQSLLSCCGDRPSANDPRHRLLAQISFRSETPT